MHTIKNLTNSPYDIRCKGGKVARLPARGEITVIVDPMHLPLYRTLGYFTIRDRTKPKRAKKQVDPVLAKLRADYKALVGKKAFGAWDADELQKRIDKALEA